MLVFAAALLVSRLPPLAEERWLAVPVVVLFPAFVEGADTGIYSLDLPVVDVLRCLAPLLLLYLRFDVPDYYFVDFSAV